MIRPLHIDDLKQLVTLRDEVPSETSGDSNPRETENRAIMEQLLPALFVGYPRDIDGIHNLVDETSAGKLTAMLAVTPRRYRLEGKEISAAVSAELFVDPAERGQLTGIKLLKHYLDGPQDLSIADLANEKTRKLWLRMGGEIASRYNWNWMRVFSPARMALWMASTSGLPRFASMAGGPIAGIADKLVGKRFQPGTTENLVIDALDPETFANQLAEVTSENLQPHYTVREARWLWHRLDLIWRDAGPSRKRLVRDDNGALLGWFIYQHRSGMPGRVAHMASAEGQQERVLNALFTDAMSVGAIGLTGRIQPSFQQALADNHCVLTARQTHTLIHARDPAILEAVKRGDMALTMIDGEGPLQLWNNPSHGLAKIEAMKSDANVHYLNNTETRSAA